MSRQSRRSSPRQEGNASRCAKDRQKDRRPRPAVKVGTTVERSPNAHAPLGDIVVEKQLLAKLALHNTSCAGCVASVRSLLARPLSELRMLKAVVDEHSENGTPAAAFRLKAAYVNDHKRIEQLIETFPMSSVLKKVQPVGSAQRCQLHRRLISMSLASAGAGGGGYGGNGSGSCGGNNARGGSASTDSWDWEDAWERMPPNLRNEVATVRASDFEAAIHNATEPSRFCPDCKHNVVQAHDILMGKIDVEDSENEEEFDKEMFLPLEDRVFEGESGRSEDKVLICDVMDVEDLIYFHEEFTSEDLDSTCSGHQQRHASTLDQGQREVRSVLGALLLSQLRSVWHAQTAQVQGEQYLFCLVVDALRTMVAAHLAAPHGDDLMAKDDRERCAAEERRQKRRQKRKERKRAGKAQLHLSSSPSSSSVSSGGGGGGGGGERGTGRSVAVAAKSKASSSQSSAVSTAPPLLCSGRGDGSATWGDHTINGADANAAAASVVGELGGEVALLDRNRDHRLMSKSVEPPGAGRDLHETRDRWWTASEKEGGNSETARSRVAAGLSSGFAAKASASHGAFGTGGLAFQLGCGGEDGSDDDGVDHELIMEMEQLKASLRSKSDIDFLRKTLRQNYDRFISQGAGRVR